MRCPAQRRQAKSPLESGFAPIVRYVPSFL
jgi:hypothetical protein